MKIPKSVRDLHQEILPTYQKLEEVVNKLVVNKKERRWHYEGRIKTLESFALKLETGREKNPKMPEDFFGCFIVVENHARIPDAEKFVAELFQLHSRRPEKTGFTFLEPHSFSFDDLRLYVKWKDDPTQKPTGLEGVLFEVQIKTFLQHAWGIATHDFVYKSDDVDWASSRIAYQVKAMLENAELSIGQAKRLTESTMLAKVDKKYSDLKLLIAEIRNRWELEMLPKDLRRLAENIDSLIRILRLNVSDLWADVDEATKAGRGAKTLNLSPYGAVLAALIYKRGAAMFEPLAHPNNRKALFVPTEIDLPELQKDAQNWIIRP